MRIQANSIEEFKKAEEQIKKLGNQITDKIDYVDIDSSFSGTKVYIKKDLDDNRIMLPREFKNKLSHIDMGKTECHYCFESHFYIIIPLPSSRLLYFNL